jgi:hypothetical protein
MLVVSREVTKGVVSKSCQVTSLALGAARTSHVLVRLAIPVCIRTTHMQRHSLGGKHY